MNWLANYYSQIIEFNNNSHLFKENDKLLERQVRNAKFSELNVMSHENRLNQAVGVSITELLKPDSLFLLLGYIDIQPTTEESFINSPSTEIVDMYKESPWIQFAYIKKNNSSAGASSFHSNLIVLNAKSESDFLHKISEINNSKDEAFLGRMSIGAMAPSLVPNHHEHWVTRSVFTYCASYKPIKESVIFWQKSIKKLQ